MAKKDPLHELCISLASQNYSRVGGLVSARVFALLQKQPEISGNLAAAIVSSDCANHFPRLVHFDVYGEPALDGAAARILACALKDAFKHQGLLYSPYVQHAVSYPALHPNTAEMLKNNEALGKSLESLRNHSAQDPEPAFEATLRSRELYFELLHSGLSFDQEHAVFCLIECGNSLLSARESKFWEEHACPALISLASGAEPASETARAWLASLDNTQYQTRHTRSLIAFAKARQEAGQIGSAAPEPDAFGQCHAKRASL